MPLKPPAKERAWGTRYDTLGSSPPLSPAASQAVPVALSPTAVKLPSDPTKSPRITSNASSPSTERNTLSDNTPHDASIFVGSLPANVDRGELTQGLLDHLSGYPQIKTIKVVRDSRGGVCAFVQCDSPTAAGHVLQSLQVNPPGPFLGRFLRFEPAKAFRTLLISYRVPSGSTLGSLDGLTEDDGSRPTNSLHAYAMRVFRPRNAKYLGLLYDKEAIAFQADLSEECGNLDKPDAFAGEGLSFNPLKYDEDTMRLLVAAFGPLESFKTILTDGDNEVDDQLQRPSHPFPHNGPRSADMSPGVWEVKWEDREDSVTALLTLRRVPHLTVSWAHHPPSTATSTPHRSTTFHTPGAFASPIQGRRLNAHNFDCAMPTVSHTSPLLLRTASMHTQAPLASPLNDSTDAYTPASGLRWADQDSDFDIFEDSRPPHPSALQDAAPIVDNTGARHVDVDPTKTSVKTHGGHTAPIAPRLEPYFSQMPGNAKGHAASGGPSPIAREGPNIPYMHAGGEGSTYSITTPFRPREWAKEIDPTAIFVGGLEVPDSWDEGKLRRVFGRFGSVEEVQLVKPPNKRSAFAFVKFAIAESAARAVQEEHNRIYDGRPIRVQLRDRNPAPRGSWRPGRGRGRALFVGPHVERNTAFGSSFTPCIDTFRAHQPGETVPIDRVPAPLRSIPAELDSPTRESPEPGTLHGIPEHVLKPRSSQDGTSTSCSSISSSTTKVPSLHCDVSRGAPSTVTSATSPPPSTSISTSTSSTTPMPPYSMNVGFLPPQPWLPPYPAPYPYAMPFVPGYGYAGYPYAPVHPIPHQLFPRDATVGGMPGATLPPTTVVKPDTAEGTQLAQRQGIQPPLRATGFIQNEHGALIPVYQREALDQYMANAHGRPPPVIPSQMPPQHGPIPASASNAWTRSAPPFPPYPAYPGTYPVNIQGVPSATAPPSILPSVQPQYWMPGSIPYGAAAFSTPSQNISAPSAVAPGACHESARAFGASPYAKSCWPQQSA